MKVCRQIKPDRIRDLLVSIAALVAWSIPASAQPTPLPPPGVNISGTVLDPAKNAVDGASVLLEGKLDRKALATKTDLKGSFVFPAVKTGTYLLSAEKSGLHSRIVTISVSSNGCQNHIELGLESPPLSGASRSSSTAAIEFADQPNFSVAGVTDWTAVGGHGSDAVLRTSEDLARETAALNRENSAASTVSSPGEAGQSEAKLREAAALSPGSFDANHQLGEFYLRSGRYREAIPPLSAAYHILPADFPNERDLALANEAAGDLAEAKEHIRSLLTGHDSADLHRLAGRVDEKAGDPLDAVHQYEQAVRMDPSEQNYFDWGSELLVHRAVWQALEVFGTGSKAYPKSARMLAALGTALFAGARYDEAALRLCEASDLDPKDPEPYIFLGKVAIAAPTPLACVDGKLARFVKLEPDNSLANYLYAMALLKGREKPANRSSSEPAEALLTKAVTLDPKCADAWLQLGIESFSRGDTQKSIDLYTRAIAANPQLGEAHYRLGVAYDRIGESARAKEEFQLHGEIEKREAQNIERERREIKQFMVVLEGQPATPPVP